MNKEVIFILLNDFADWEGAFLAPALRAGVMPGSAGSYDVKYLTPDGRPVRSLGGMQVSADYDASALPEPCAGLILVGGMSWRTPEAETIVPLVTEAQRRGLPIGAICNAVSFLAAHGFLNGVRHTGNTVAMLREWGGEAYTGASLYVEQEAVRDGATVTANGSGFLEFTRECLLALKADTEAHIEASYRFNKEGFLAFMKHAGAAQQSE